MTDRTRTILFWFVTGTITLGFLFGSFANLTGDPAIKAGLSKVGWAEFQTPLGISMLVYATLFLLPPTRKVGFALMSAHLGGSIAIEIAQGKIPPLAPIVMNILLWTGFNLRYPEVFRMADKTSA
jgi:hypothetical protein